MDGVRSLYNSHYETGADIKYIYILSQAIQNRVCKYGDWRICSENNDFERRDENRMEGKGMGWEKERAAILWE